MKLIAVFCFVFCVSIVVSIPLEPEFQSPSIYDDFLKDVVQASERSRSKREPVEPVDEVVGRAVMDVLNGGYVYDDNPGEDLRRNTRDDGDMLIMGNPNDAINCEPVESREAMMPWPYQQFYTPMLRTSVPPTVDVNQGHVLPPVGVYDGVQIADGYAGAVGHSLGGFGGISSLGGFGGVASVATPISHEAHVYLTTIPYISGYKMTPIISEKQVIVKDAPKAPHGIIGHKSETIAKSSLPDNIYTDCPTDVVLNEPRETSQIEVMSSETYADTIRNLQQQIDHLQSLKLAQERQSQPEDANAV